MEEKELLKLSVIEKGKVRKALVSYCNKYGIKCKSRNVFIDATMSLFEKGLADALNKLQNKQPCEYKPSELIPLSNPVEVCTHNPQLHCPECKHYGLPKKHFVFTTKDGKQIFKQIENCKECNYEIQSCYITFKNEQEKEEHKKLLNKCGQKWTEK